MVKLSHFVRAYAPPTDRATPLKVPNRRGRYEMEVFACVRGRTWAYMGVHSWKKRTPSFIPKRSFA